MTRELNFDPSREPLLPDEELWGGLLRPGDANDVYSDESSSRVDTSLSDTSDDNALDARIRAIAEATYHVPGESSVPRDAMWAAISARRASPATDGQVQYESDTPPPVIVHRLTPRTHRRLWPMFAALAATLVIGVAIGRSVDRSTQTTPTVVAGASDDGAPRGSASGNTAASSSTNVSGALPLMLAQLTVEHLGRSEALLVSAKQQPSALEADGTLQGWARDLLSTTRLLLDTDQLTDPRMRQLLQDLELTLALILQAQASGRAVDAQAVRDDLDSGDLLLRVRSASMPSMLSTDDVRGMSE